MITNISNTEHHTGEMRPVFDTLLEKWRTFFWTSHPRNDMSNVPLDTHISIKNYDIRKFQPQSDITFELSHHQCWFGIEDVNIFGASNSRHSKGIQLTTHESCQLILHFARPPGQCLVTVDCPHASNSHRFIDSYIKGDDDLWYSICECLRYKQQKDLYDRTFTNMADTSFNDLLRALFDKMQEQGLVRDRSSGDLYSHEIFEGPYSFVKRYTATQFVDDLYYHPSNFGIVGTLKHTYVKNLVEHVKTNPS